MNRLRASLLQTSLLALAAVCGLQSAFDAHAQGASPPPGKALVVLYRADKQPVAARIPMIANADRLGDLGNGEFMNAVVNPGRTFLRAGDRILTTLALQTSANQTYYVLVEAVAGMTPVRAEMREMTAAAANRSLAQSRPAAVGAPAAAAARAPAAAAAAAPLVAAPAAAPVRPAPAPAQPAPAAAPPPAPRQVQAPPPPKPAAPPPPRAVAEPAEKPVREWEFAVIAKGGAFKLANLNQTIAGLDSTYEKSSKPAVGLEVEMRNEEGLAVGAEIFYWKNKLTPNGTTLQASQAAVAGFLNAKYYFEATDWFYPFVGAGLGYAGTTFSGDLQGSTGGFAYQGLLGADLRFGSVGLYLEYKYLGATTADKGGQTVKAGGTGILAGISIAF